MKNHFTSLTLKMATLLLNLALVMSLRVPSPSQFTSGLWNLAKDTPLFSVVEKAYSFFYWLPRRNLPQDSPPIYLRNSSLDFISWYQIPHNLPPYGFLDEGYPSDFFCYGMPGNTLPLGNWDPWGLHQVSPEIVRRYRESEIKHGRLAMLGVVGFLLQEQHHPRHQDLGGLAITHMQQLSTNMFSFGGLSTEFGIMGSGEIDFVMVISTLCLLEILALTRNWDVTRSGNTYHHQFFDVLGIGKLKSNYKNGDYGFDPFKLKPPKEEDRREFIEAELNHGRLAMISFTVMLLQEYFFGEPASQCLVSFFLS